MFFGSGWFTGFAAPLWFLAIGMMICGIGAWSKRHYNKRSGDPSQINIPPEALSGPELSGVRALRGSGESNRSTPKTA